jgi:O-antigen/teichoic acid export membrane protein
MSLRNQFITGVIYAGMQQFGSQGILFIVHVILARILDPSDYGLVAMLGIFISIGNVLMDGGLGKSIMRSKEATDHDYNTLFFANIFLSLISYSLIFLGSSFIAEFFNQPSLTLILRVYALVLIIRAFSKVQNARLSKFLNFKTQLQAALPSTLAGSIVGITLAYQGYGVWSLVFLTITEAIVWTIILWFKSNWTPSFYFSRSIFKKHFSFGYKVKLTEMITAMSKELFKIFIAKFYTPAQLGIYTRALSLQSFPVTNVSTILNKVSFPALAKIQDDNERLKDVNKKLMMMVTFILAPLLFSAALMGEPLFRFLLTEKWLPSVPFFQVLCVAGIFHPLSSYNLNILLVKGRSDIFMKTEMMNKLFILIGLGCAYFFGIMAVVWGQLGINLAIYLVNSRVSGRMINYTLRMQVKDLFPLISLAALSALIAFQADMFVFNKFHDLIRIVSMYALTMLFYIGFTSITGSYSIKEIVQYIKLLNK